MTNIAKLLKDCPTGTKLYSPLFGEVKFKYINGSKFGVVVEDSEECCRSFDKYGRYFAIYKNAECLLFPSKDCRTWEGWKLPTKPKFDVGNWIIFNNYFTIPIQIIGIREKDDIYVCRSIEGIDGNYSISSVDSDYHPWTIADAKDGDVLVAHEVIGLFKEIDGLNIRCHFSYHYMNTPMVFTNALHNKMAFRPATKDERELLFAKMNEAGYQWDVEKKELRKIIEPNFKVGDKIKATIYGIERKVTIREVDKTNRCYFGTLEECIGFSEQDQWHLAPRLHYDISNFYAGMPVLVRETNLNAWQYVLFSHCYIGGDGLTRFNAGLVGLTQCIPFNNDTEHLLGTTDMCDEQYINW